MINQKIAKIIIGCFTYCDFRNFWSFTKSEFCVWRLERRRRRRKLKYWWRGVKHIYDINRISESWSPFYIGSYRRIRFLLYGWDRIGSPNWVKATIIMRFRIIRNIGFWLGNKKRSLRGRGRHIIEFLLFEKSYYKCGSREFKKSWWDVEPSFTL